MVQARNTTLPPDKVAAAFATISAWRQDPTATVACPVCGTAGLVIVDRSARPYAEWYALSCTACGLDQALHLPMTPPPSSYD